MTPHEIRLVRKSFDLVRPIAEPVAALFCDKLFERDTLLAARLPADLAGERLVQGLDEVIGLLDRPAELAPVLQALSGRLADAGVAAAQHRLVGAVLIDTLAAAIGAVFTPSIRAAWASLVQDVSTALNAGAAQARAQPEAIA